jgi:hypothetical protein
MPAWARCSRPSNPVVHAAALSSTRPPTRGAGYTAFDGTAREDPGHGAVAAPYAHVTAPLRRLADRYATEVCLSLSDGHAVPDWVREALPRLPELMATADRRASAAERGAVDLAEAVLVAGREGEEFDAIVIDVNGSRPHRIRASGGKASDGMPEMSRCPAAPEMSRCPAPPALAIAAETVSIRSGGEKCRRICRMQVRICPAM